MRPDPHWRGSVLDSQGRERERESERARPRALAGGRSDLPASQPATRELSNFLTVEETGTSRCSPFPVTRATCAAEGNLQSRLIRVLEVDRVTHPRPGGKVNHSSSE